LLGLELQIVGPIREPLRLILIALIGCLLRALIEVERLN